MTTAAMVTYAYDQIDQARTELRRPAGVRVVSFTPTAPGS
jgi:hypothetical protein